MLPCLLPTSPQFFAHLRCGPSLARFFARLFDLRLEKERKRLLHRLPIFLLNFNVCRYSIYLMFKVFSREIGLFPRKLFTAPSLSFWTNYACAVFNWVVSLTKNSRVLCIIALLIYFSNKRIITHKNTDSYR